MGVFRFPLAMPYEPRDATSEKDSVMVNCFTEFESEELVYQVKRPGLTSVYEASATEGRGIFAYGDTLFIWTSLTPNLAPVELPIGSL